MLDRYDQRVLIGEIYLPIERLVTYYGKDLGGAHLPFKFSTHLHRLDGARARDAGHGIRARVAAGRLAQLGARQS